MSAILAVSCKSADGGLGERCKAAVSRLSERGDRVIVREARNGLIASACPSPAADAGIPGADFAERGGVLCACHGSLYELDDLYKSMGIEKPADADTHPAGAILDSYLRWGQGAVRYWTGEASFAIFDARQRMLIAGRDHLGTRPLFYSGNGELTALSTDIRTLLALHGKSPEPDPVVMRRFLCQGYFHDERTFFLKVSRVQPGSFVLVRDGRVTEMRYWRLEDAEPVRYRDPEDYGRRFVELLSQSIERRHVRSPAFGSSLSGGLDSSSMVCLVHELRKRAGIELPLPVAAVAFPGSRYDESEYIDAVIDKCGNTGAVTSPHYWDVFEELERLCSFHDEPGIAMSVVIFWIQKAVARDVGMRWQLSGAGADEVLAGELHYFSDILRTGKLKDLAAEIGGYARINSMGHSRTALALLMRYGIAPLTPKPLRDIRRAVSPRQSFPWLGPALGKLPREPEPQPAPGFNDMFHREMAVTVQSRYTPLLLLYEDRNSGKVGIESRFPFLDLDLVRFCFGIPREELMSEGQAKVVLKRGMRGILPEAVWRREAKSGIPELLTTWLTRTYRPRVESWLRSSRLVADGWLRGPELNQLYERYAGGEHGLRRRFWRAFALEGWYRNFWP